ncbi:hypothetical protein ARTHRO9AX_150059 [Arthrobacter sp. 9AX]|nr:hypothetical protein ARTHRO9AX_150059 [Arthrobacter sp. 9AX]
MSPGHLLPVNHHDACGARRIEGSAGVVPHVRSWPGTGHGNSSAGASTGRLPAVVRV